MRTIILLPFILLYCFHAASPPGVIAQAQGPRLEISPSPVDFDTVFCGGSRCMDIVLRNTGDTALTVQQFSALNTPFEGSVTTPFILRPNEEHRTQWCYRPTRVRGRDSIRVDFTSDNRIRYSFGLLADMSPAMNAPFPGAGSAMEAARAALDRFVATMMEDGSPQHEGAVFAYSTTSQYRLLRSFTEDPAVLRASLPGTISGTHACIWHAMDRTTGLLQGSRHKRLLIIINGSSDAGLQNCGPYSAAGVADAVTAANMMVCSISINGAASTGLAEIAARSGGLHTDVASSEDLEAAIHDIILHLQRAIPQRLTVSGEVVSPSLAFSPDAIFVPATAVGDTLRRKLQLRNAGTAPMDLGTVHGETDAFTLVFPPEQVAAGAEVEATLFFHPTEQGYETTQLYVDINGCDPARPAISAHGVAFDPEAMNPGPVLVTGEERIDVGDIDCAGEHQIDIPVRNVGDQPLTLSDPQVMHPRLLVEPLPTPLPAGGENSITLRLHPDGMLGRDSATFTCAAEVRRTTHTLVLIDAASRLRWLSEDGLSGEDMSSAVIGMLLGGLVTSEEVQDHMGVLSVNRTVVSTLQSMTESRTALAAVHPSAGNSDTTALPHGIAAAIDTLRMHDGIRRLVILTAGSRIDGADSTLPRIADLAERAMEYDIHISAFSPLNSLSADTLDSFLDMVGVERIFLPGPEMLPPHIDAINAVRIVVEPYSWELFWRSITSDMAVVPEHIDIGKSAVGRQHCSDITVLNTGEALLRITHISSDDVTVFSPTPLPLSVASGDSATLQLCHTPAVLGPWNIEADIHGNSCVRPSITITLGGVATDGRTLSLEGVFIARPQGSIVIPLHLEKELPADYDIRELTLRIGYEASLLYPDMDLPVIDADGNRLAGTTNVTQEFDTEEDMAVTTYTISRQADETPLVTSGEKHHVLALRMRAYLGRVLRGDIHLLSATFPGSDVALDVDGSAILRLDSMLWLEQRLVDATALWGVLGKNAPNPTTDRCRIPYTIDSDLQVRIALYDLHGRVVRVVDEGAQPAGRHEVTLQTHGLPPGIYIYRLETPRGKLSRILVHRPEGS